jgi:hypothetical protein
MALLPNVGKLLYSEKNVNIPQGTKADAAYDLALYPELGNESRGVLVVTVIGSFKFVDGTTSNPATPGVKLTWTALEKSIFMDGFKNICAAAWGEQHRITTTSRFPAIKDIGVIFDIKCAEGMSTFDHSHWNMTTTKIDANWVVSSVRACGGWVSNGEIRLDSVDLTPVSKGGPQTQRDAVHEFGHMLGLRDEYPAANDNLNWLTDPISVMHFSEKVQPRHYVFFADWIGRQWQSTTSMIRPDEWKVNGTINLMNAQI